MNANHTYEPEDTVSAKDEKVNRLYDKFSCHGWTRASINALVVFNAYKDNKVSLDDFLENNSYDDRAGTHHHCVRGEESPELTSRSRFQQCATISPEVIDLTIPDYQVPLASSSRSSKKQKVSKNLPTTLMVGLTRGRGDDATLRYSPKCRNGKNTIFSVFGNRNKCYYPKIDVLNQFSRYCMKNNLVEGLHMINNKTVLLPSIAIMNGSTQGDLQKIYINQTDHCINQLINVLNSMGETNLVHFKLSRHLDELYQIISEKGLTINIHYAAFCAIELADKSRYVNYVTLIQDDLKRSGLEVSASSIRVMLWLATKKDINKQTKWKTFFIQKGQAWQNEVCYPTDFLSSNYHRLAH